MDLTPSAIEKLAELLGQSYVPSATVEEGGKPFIMRPGDADTGLELVDMEEFLKNPVRKRADFTVCDATSFGIYVNKHKSEKTLVACSVKGLRVTAILDHHGPYEAGWAGHTCTLQLERSPDWDKWKGVDGKPMTQTGFADFLLEMDHTIADPQAASIIEIVTKLRLESNKKFESKVNQVDGSFTFLYSDEAVQTKGQLKLPEKMVVSVAPFRGAKPVDMLVLVRYRLEEGSLKLFFKLMNPEEVVEEAFEQVVSDVTLLIQPTPVLRQA